MVLKSDAGDPNAALWRVDGKDRGVDGKDRAVM